MNNLLKKSKQLHELYHGSLPDVNDFTRETINLRKYLITEEFNETIEALERLRSEAGTMDEGKRIAELACELSDIIVVVVGTAVALGIPHLLADAYETVHAVNMSKCYDTEKDAMLAINLMNGVERLSVSGSNLYEVRKTQIEGEDKFVIINSSGKIMKRPGIEKPAEMLYKKWKL